MSVLTNTQEQMCVGLTLDKSVCLTVWKRKRKNPEPQGVNVCVFVQCHVSHEQKHAVMLRQLRNRFLTL